MQNIDQSNYSRNSASKKLSTPSLIFCKSGSKSPITRLRTQASLINREMEDSERKSVGMHCCQNHNNKRASFVVSTIRGEKYCCEKCAISLASQGHLVTKMSDKSMMRSSALKYSQRKQMTLNPRQQEVHNFLESIRQLEQDANYKKQEIRQKLIQSEEFYGMQIQQINDYFQMVTKSLELEKNKCYNYILQERKKAETETRFMNNGLDQLLQQIQRIVKDIQGNIETVYCIDENMYNLVFSQYLSQKEDFQRKIQNILINSIEMRKIEFAGVPQEIECLSDLVIPNISQKESSTSLGYKLAESQNGEDINMQALSPRDSQNQQFLRENMRGNFKLSSSGEQCLKFSFEAEKLKMMKANY